MKHNFSDLKECLLGVRTVAISGHVKPDGDCVGSTLGVYNYIKTYYPGIEATLFLEPYPMTFSFLTGAEEIISDYPDRNDGFDLFISCDCSNKERMGQAVKYFDAAKKTVCIDHHISNEGYADLYYIFPEASSASELVFELMGADAVTKEIAECLYTGIIHDTGVFQYSCTSAKTMSIGGILMEKGIDYPAIADHTFYTKSFVQNKILGQALMNAALYCDDKIIASVLTREDLRRHEALPKHLDGIVNQLRITKGTQVALFLYENEDGTFKGSLRVNGDINVARIAESFGGGGHVKAAGYTIEGPAQKALSESIAAIEAYLEA